MATISPYAPVPLLDTFTRATDTGGGNERWSVTDTGAAWRSTKTVNFNISYNLSDPNDLLGEGIIDVTQRSPYGTAWLSLVSAGFEAEAVESEALALIKYTSNDAYPLTDFGLVLNREDTDTFYYCSIHGNVAELSIGAYSGTTRHELNRRSKTIKKDVYYWVRFQRESNYLNMKIWEKGHPEPATWTITSNIYTGSNPPGLGTPGIFYKGTSDTYAIHVDHYAFYTKNSNVDVEPGKPVTDTFNRYTNDGFGKASTGQTWEGHFSADPWVNTIVGYTNGTDAVVRILNTGNYYGFVGPSTTSAVETYAEFEVNTSSTSNYFYMYFGLHGENTPSAGLVQATGYAVRVQSGSNKLGIWKKTSPTGGWTLINEVNLAFSLAANTVYKIKLQKTGSTLRANCWTGTEPSSWLNTTTDSSITAGGRAFVHVTQDSDATRTFKMNAFSYGALTKLPGEPADTTTTTTGSLVLNSTDSSITYRFNYTGDSDNDNSIVIQHRKSTRSNWTTVTSPSPVTGGSPKYYEATISSLDPLSTYTIRGTFSDSDDLFGVNPVVGTIATTNTRSQISKLSHHNVGTTTADMRLEYTRDTNNNATATIQKRAFGTWSTFFTHDFYTGNYLTDLEGLVGSSSSDTFTKLTAGSLQNPNLEAQTYLGRAFLKANSADFFDGNVAVYLGDFTGQSQMTLNAQIYFFDYGYTRTGFAFRGDLTANTYYYCYLAPVNTEGKCLPVISKKVAGVITELVRGDPVYVELDTFYEIELRMADVSGDNVKIFYLDGNELCRTTDNSITSPHKAGIFFESQGYPGSSQLTDISYGYGQGNALYGFTVDGRPSSGSWDSAVAMTAYAAAAGPFPELTHRYFVYPATGLSIDTFYEFKAVLADADGIVGETYMTDVFLTHGNKGYLTDDDEQTLSYKTYPTSAVVTTKYYGDSDEDSSLLVQYKLNQEKIWTTIPAALTTANRSTKRFQTVISGLKPSSSYDVRVVLSDPDGIEDHKDSTAAGVFSTTTVHREHDKPLKSYLWKVYDNATGGYVTSWADAGAPKFTFEENSGVSDLTVRLPRKVSSLNNTASNISHQNIVDVWVVDTYELGLGPNLIEDEDFTIGKWTFTVVPGVAYYHATQGVVGDMCIKLEESGSTIHEITSEAIFIDPVKGVKNNAPDLYKNREDFRRRTFILSAYAKAQEGRAVLGVYEYGEDGEGGENQLLFGSEIGETVGSDWQRLLIPYRITHPDTKYIRIVLRNDGPGTYWFDKGSVRAKEQLVYSGHIETIESVIDQDTEYINIEIYGEASVLSDDYIEFLQFVERPQARDRVYDTDGNPLLDEHGEEIEKLNYGAADPSSMMKYVIDLAQQQNPKCRLYYTEDSIRNTGITDAQYTFREQPLRAIFDKIRDLAPSGWHYVIMPDGMVVFRGPEHVKTHILRVGVEAIYYKQVNTIKDLKNLIHFKGRQDSDFSESDGYGNILAVESDPASIDKFGRRVLYVQDASIVDPATANTFAEGRLSEMNRPENQITCRVVDEKVVFENYLGFRGYNLEAFIPGDYVLLLNPKADVEKTYWDQAIWDVSKWDYETAETLLDESVPIKSITYDDYTVEMHLSQRPPSFTSDFQRLARKSQQNDGEK